MDGLTQLAETQSCATCKFFFPVYSHPSIDGNGMSEVAFHCCTMFNEVDKNRKFVLATAEGLCEMHTKIKEDDENEWKVTIIKPEDARAWLNKLTEEAISKEEDDA